MKILCVCGARPNFMKIAAVVRSLEPHPELRPIVVHTGQHYDERLSQMMFDDLRLPRPQVNLEVGSASHAVQTAEIMRRFEPVLDEQRPDLVLVVGDVNSLLSKITRNGSVVARKQGLAEPGGVGSWVKVSKSRGPKKVSSSITPGVQIVAGRG